MDRKKGLSTGEIEKYLEHLMHTTDVKQFYVVAADKFNSLLIKSYPCIVIVNTDIEGLPGSHWLGFYLKSAW